jgi:hypothetical protein
LISSSELAKDNIVWEIESCECESCSRESVKISIRFIDSGSRFFVAFLNCESDALAFITSLKKAGITNSTQGVL